MSAVAETGEPEPPRQFTEAEARLILARLIAARDTRPGMRSLAQLLEGR